MNPLFFILSFSASWLGLVTAISPSFRIAGVPFLPTELSLALLLGGLIGVGVSWSRHTVASAVTMSLALATAWSVAIIYPLSANLYSFQGLLFGRDVGIAVLLAIFLVRYRNSRVPELSLLLLQGVGAYLFLRYAEGRLFFSDDHPSFMYRLQLLKQHFPDLPFYNPQWNAGYQAREFFASGVLNVYLLAYPLIALIDFTQLHSLSGYNLLILIVYVGLVPWGTYLSVRLLGGARVWAVIAAAAAMFPSVAWSDWLLRYGTLGFCLSAGLFPLALVLLAKVYLEEQVPSWLLVLAAVVVSTLCLLWSLTALALVPLGLVVVWRMIHRPRRHMLVATLFLILLNLPWAIVFVRESKVLTFLQGSSRPASVFTAAASSDASPKAASEDFGDRFTEASRGIREACLKMNPPILLIGFLGLLSITAALTRRVFVATALWLFTLALLGDAFKPQLELHRMFLFLLFLSASGLGIALTWLTASFRTIATAKWQWGTAIVATSLVLLSPIAFASVLSGSSREQVALSPPYLGPLVETLKAHGGEGRVFFPGFILHELGARAYDTQDGGHVALLPMLTQKPMYAFNFYHTSWSIVDPIPRSYRKRDRVGVNEFFDLLNVTAVVTFKREWARFFSNRPAYQLVAQHGRFRVFRRVKGHFGYFLRGSGELRVLSDGLEIIPHSSEVVIKFRYHPNLKIEEGQGAVLFPEHVFDDDLPGGQSTPVHFIGLRLAEDQQGKVIRIKM